MRNEIYSPQEDSYFLSRVLEEQIPKSLKKNPDLTLLEIGSGSGIQLEIAFKLGIKKQNLFSCDINSRSIEYCKSLGFKCIHSDLFENIKGKFDLIVFNPPYLPEDSLEPKSSAISTTGGKKGSEVINKFLQQAKKHLKKKGKIFLLSSSLSGKINFLDYNEEIIAKKNLFFEELTVWKLGITTS